MNREYAVVVGDDSQISLLRQMITLPSPLNISNVNLPYFVLPGDETKNFAGEIFSGSIPVSVQRTKEQLQIPMLVDEELIDMIVSFFGLSTTDKYYQDSLRGFLEEHKGKYVICIDVPGF